MNALLEDQNYMFLIKPLTVKEVIISDGIKDFLSKNKHFYRATDIKEMEDLLDKMSEHIVSAHVNLQSPVKFYYKSDVVEYIRKKGLSANSLQRCFINAKDILIQHNFNVSFIRTNVGHAALSSFHKVQHESGSTRTVYMRSKNGGYKPAIYELEFIDGKAYRKNLQHAKFDYSKKSGCPYTEVRPVLYKSIIGLPKDDWRRDRTNK